jgi:hypothetical protein
MDKEIKFTFLKDEPASKKNEDFFRFYHDKFSPALKDIVKSDSCVHTIGLFGRWGTGKSTIIDLLKEELDLKLFVFDAWKYQEDSLRRIFLIKLVEFLKLSSNTIDDHILDPLYKAKEITIDSGSKNDLKKSFLAKIAILFKKFWLYLLIVLFGTTWGVLQFKAKQDATFLRGLRDIARDLFGLGAFSAILIPTLEKLLGESLNKVFSSVLPWSEIRTQVEREECLNSPEQFEYLFNKIIENVDEKMVIVFDNIDRVQGDVAIKILSTIKTFLDPIKKSNIIFIVPCDADAIIEQIKTFYNESSIARTFDASEYLRKLFNVIIFTPEFIDNDLEEYTKHLINQTGEIKDLLLDEDVILVITKAFTNNPREIKQFVNNLISAILIVLKTEVAEDILQKGRIAYLAKILVLKQKFPNAYVKLKDNWYSPDSIIDGGIEVDQQKELVDFINNTSRITTDDAEPYIYYKKPEIAGNITNTKVFRQYLLSNEQEEFDKAFLGETNKAAVIDYVLLLLKRYRGQHGPLLNIFKTQLLSFSRSTYQIVNKNYFEESLKLLDSALWQDYFEFPVDLVFTFLLNNVQANISLKNAILERYILLLAVDQLKHQKNNFAIDLVLSIIKYQNLFSRENIGSIRKYLEEFYSSDSALLELFKKKDDQQKFITPTAFRKFIDGITIEKVALLCPIIIQYGQYISDNNMALRVLERTQEWMTQETVASPEFRPEKEKIVQSIHQIVKLFKGDIVKLQPLDKEAFAKAFINAFNNVSVLGNRTMFVNLMHRIFLALEDPQKSQYSNLLQEYFRRASAENLKTVFRYWSSTSAPLVLSLYLNFIMPRIVNEPDVLNAIYEFANKDQKILLINYLISNAPDHGLAFIGSLDGSIPDRQEIIKSLLVKAESVNALQRGPVYDYLNRKFSVTDDATVKDAAVNQIKNLLKSDDWTIQQVGYNFLSGASYLSEEKKREIAKEILEFLRQPGKSVSESHRFSLKAISDMYNMLQETLKRDFVFLIFNNIKKERSLPAIQVFLDAISKLSLGFSDFEKDFKDLLSELGDWPDGESKKLVISKILELKSKSPNKIENEYWLEIEKIEKIQK